MHGYHAHPSDFTTKGSKVAQDSLIANGNRLFCSMASTRYADRPLLITEYGQVFWNRYRYEEGLLMGCYAALQDIDCLMAHASPVIDQMHSPIRPFSVGHDPIARASQVVSGYAFLRRDVAPSPHLLEITLQKQHIFDAVNHAKALSTEQARLALLTGIGLRYADEPAPAELHPRKPDLRLPVFGTSETIVKEMFSDVRESVSGDKPLAGVVGAMKKASLLPDANRTDPEAGIYESDTGELLLETRAHRFRATTSRMEGVCIDPAAKPERVALKRMTVESTSVTASITLVAADDVPLEQSRRMLLVYATDALNSDMTFTTTQREELVRLGKLPVLVRTGRLKIAIATPLAANLRAWALGMDGHRVEEIEVTRLGDKSLLSIDTARLKSITPFFELAEK